MIFRFFELVFNHKKILFLGILMASVFFCFGVAKLKMDVSSESVTGESQLSSLQKKFLVPESKTRNIFVIAHDEHLFTKENLKILKNLQEDLQAIGAVSRVTSLYSLPNFGIYFKDGKSVPVITGKEQTTEQLDNAKKAALQNKIFINKFISPDAKTLAFVVELKPVEDGKLLFVRNEVEQVLQSDVYKQHFLSVYQIGSLEIRHYSYEHAMKDLWVLGIFSVVILVLTFGWFYKNIFVGLLPLITAGISLLWSFGILGYLSIPLNALTSVVIVLAFTIGAMENAHFIHVYQKKLNSNKSKAPIEALRYIFYPMLFATLTTCAGFVFNIFSSVKLLEDFAIALCLLIVVNMFVLCLVLPALVQRINIKSYEYSIGFAFMSKIVVGTYQKLRKLSFIPISIIVLIIAYGFYVLPKISIEMLSYINFYESSSIMQKIKNTDKYLGGTRTLSVYMSSAPGVFRDKPGLDMLLKIEQEINHLKYTSSSYSIASVLASGREILMSDDDIANSSIDNNYKIPDSARMLSAFYQHAAGNDLFRSLMTNDYGAAKIVLTYQVYNTQDYLEYINHIKAILAENLDAGLWHYEVQSGSSMAVEVTKNILQIQLISITVIYLVIFLLMTFLFKSIKAGIVSLIPNLFPVAAVLLAFYWLSLPFYASTVIVLAAVLGLAVDDTIHIMFAYKNSFEEYKNTHQSIIKAICLQVRPVTITSMTLVVGVAALLFSSLKGVMHFSLLLIIGVVFAWIADLVVTPFLLKKFELSKNSS